MGPVQILLKLCGYFFFGKYTKRFEGIWNMTYVFPLRSMLEKWNPVPNPFEIVFAVFVLEKAKLVSK